MAIELQPTGRSLLVVLGVLVFAFIGMYTSGALLTLGLLALLIGLTLYLAWVCGVRVTRRLTGA